MTQTPGSAQIAGQITTGFQTLCVLWHEPGSVIDPRLIQALTRPGMRVERCTDAFAATAWMSRHASRDAALAGVHRVLLLCEPARLDGAAEVVRALPNFVEAPIYWVHEPRASEQVRALDQHEIQGLLERDASAGGEGGAAGGAVLDSELRAFLDERAVRSTTQTWSAPPLRLAGAGPDVAANTASDQPVPAVLEEPTGGAPSTPKPASAQPRRHLLTDEEIAMLLDEPEGR
jgi:hypothetical protein